MAPPAPGLGPAWTRTLLVVLALFLLFTAATGLKTAEVRDVWTWKTTYAGTATPENETAHAFEVRLPASAVREGLEVDVARASVSLHATGPPAGLPVRARLVDANGQTILVHDFDPRRPLAPHEHPAAASLASGAYELRVTALENATAYEIATQLSLPFGASSEGARANPYALALFGLAALLAAAAPLLRRLAPRPPP